MPKTVKGLEDKAVNKTQGYSQAFFSYLLSGAFLEYATQNTLPDTFSTLPDGGFFFDATIYVIYLISTLMAHIVVGGGVGWRLQ